MLLPGQLLPTMLLAFMHIYLNNPFIGHAYVPHILNVPCHENAYVPHVSLISESSAPSHFKSLSPPSGVWLLESLIARGRPCLPWYFLCARQTFTAGQTHGMMDGRFVRVGGGGERKCDY